MGSVTPFSAKVAPPAASCCVHVMSAPRMKLGFEGPEPASGPPASTPPSGLDPELELELELVAELLEAAPPEPPPLLELLAPGLPPLPELLPLPELELLAPPAPDDDSPVRCDAPHPERPTSAASTDAQTSGRVFMVGSRLGVHLCISVEPRPSNAEKPYALRWLPAAL